MAVFVDGMANKKIARKKRHLGQAAQTAAPRPDVDLRQEHLEILGLQLIVYDLFEVTASPKGVPFSFSNNRALFVFLDLPEQPLLICFHIDWQGFAPFGSQPARREEPIQLMLPLILRPLSRWRARYLPATSTGYSRFLRGRIAPVSIAVHLSDCTLTSQMESGSGSATSSTICSKLFRRSAPARSRRRRYATNARGSLDQIGRASCRGRG